MPQRANAKLEVEIPHTQGHGGEASATPLWQKHDTLTCNYILWKIWKVW